MHAPIILFIYSRLEHTKKTVEALKCNLLAKESNLIIYSDAGKDKESQFNVDSVRDYLLSIDGFKSISIIYRNENYGLAKNIMEGVTEVINKYGKAIILEDDIVTSPCFLMFMNNALDKYKSNKNVWHVSGWNYPIETDDLPDSFFWNTMNCWGWATWCDRWEHFEKEPKKLIKSWSKKDINRFNLDNSYDFWSQVEGNLNGKLNTWAIFWYATIFLNNGLCLNPSKSLVLNVGNDGSGTNCGFDDPFKSNVNLFLPELELNIATNRVALERIKKFYKSIKVSFYLRFFRKIKRIIQ